jgi:hypothetical protein
LKTINVNGIEKVFLDVSELMVLINNPDIYDASMVKAAHVARSVSIDEVMVSISDKSLSDEVLRRYADIEHEFLHSAIVAHPNASIETVKYVLKTTMGDDSHCDAKAVLQSRKAAK